MCWPERSTEGDCRFKRCGHCFHVPLCAKQSKQLPVHSRHNHLQAQTHSPHTAPAHDTVTAGCKKFAVSGNVQSAQQPLCMRQETPAAAPKCRTEPTGRVDRRNMKRLEACQAVHSNAMLNLSLAGKHAASYLVVTYRYEASILKTRPGTLRAQVAQPSTHICLLGHHSVVHLPIPKTGKRSSGCLSCHNQPCQPHSTTHHSPQATTHQPTVCIQSCSTQSDCD